MRRRIGDPFVRKWVSASFLDDGKWMMLPYYLSSTSMVSHFMSLMASIFSSNRDMHVYTSTYIIQMRIASAAIYETETICLHLQQ